MAYNFFPTGYNPYQPQYVPPTPQVAIPQNQSNGIIWVQGIEGAKAYPVTAGKAVVLMDSDANCLYLKSADNTGMPTLRVFDYTERVEAPSEPQNADVSVFATQDDLSHYATKEDLEKAISDLKKKSAKKKKGDDDDE